MSVAENHEERSPPLSGVPSATIGSLARLGTWAWLLPMMALPLVRPAEVQACSYLPPAPAFDWGAPLDGAVDVPTDVIPVYMLQVDTKDIPYDGVPGSYTLESADGTPVAFTTRVTNHGALELGSVFKESFARHVAVIAGV